MPQEPGEHLEPEPQSERGAPGSRDTGARGPGAGEDRPEGAFEEESTKSSGEPGWHPSQGSGAADASSASSDSGETPTPPYDDRQKQARSQEHMRARAGNPDGQGQAQHSEVEHKKPTSSDPGVGPSHHAGTQRGEDLPPDTEHPEQK